MARAQRQSTFRLQLMLGYAFLHLYWQLPLVASQWLQSLEQQSCWVVLTPDWPMGVLYLSLKGCLLESGRWVCVRTCVKRAASPRDKRRQSSPSHLRSIPPPPRNPVPWASKPQEKTCLARPCICVVFSRPAHLGSLVHRLLSTACLGSLGFRLGLHVPPRLPSAETLISWP